MSLELWISIGGAVVVPVVILWIRLWMAKGDRETAERVTARAEKDKENDQVHKELRLYCERLNADHYAMRLEIATSYVTRQNLEQLEDKLFRAVERIEHKLDNVISKEK